MISFYFQLFCIHQKTFQPLDHNNRSKDHKYIRSVRFELPETSTIYIQKKKTSLASLARIKKLIIYLCSTSISVVIALRYIIGYRIGYVIGYRIVVS